MLGERQLREEGAAHPPLPASAAEECAAYQRQLESRMSGGEAEDKETYREIRAMLMAEPDVFEVLALSWLPTEQKWLYCIRTPIATWPKYVVGFTDAANAAPEPIFRCGLRENALREYDDQNFGDHQ
jgi:hypothetical protein